MPGNIISQLIVARIIQKTLIIANLENYIIIIAM